MRVYIGWDVGGWHCDRNKASRDALVATAARDGEVSLLGCPWRGNLRGLLVERTGDSLVGGLLKLCEVKADAISEVVVAIDTPLGWPTAMMKLASGGATSFVSAADGENPYTRRATELDLIRRGFAPLSAVRDMLGSQSTKGIHFLRAANLIEVSTGVWRGDYEGGQSVTAIETYPAVARQISRLGALQAKAVPPAPVHDDIRDALACSLVAHLFAERPTEIEAIPENIPDGEGWIVLPKA
jgi:predicted nuclease with RNAse H fold